MPLLFCFVILFIAASAMVYRFKLNHKSVIFWNTSVVFNSKLGPFGFSFFMKIRKPSIRQILFNKDCAMYFAQIYLPFL